MAELSDQLFIVTVLAYAAAMVAHAAEYAFGKRGMVAKASTRVAVPVGGGAAPTPEQDLPPAVPAPKPTIARHLGTIAVGTMLIAAAAHLATAVTRGIAAERLPWGNMYEFILSTTLAGVLAWVVVLLRHLTLRHLGLYVALVNVVMLMVAGGVYTPVGPLVPALDSYWFIIHVSTAALASGIFLVGFVTAVMYLFRNGYDAGKRQFPFSTGRRLPGADTLERLTFRLHAFGFPIWTFAVMAGAIWAEASWGRYWGWDPKEVWAFISWVVYAAYLHARATPSVRRTITAWLVILGWLTMLMNLVGVNLFFEGLHSYA